ncbi:MAG: glycosyltransferase [Clostridia bacterium]|nr:glycosyltransferase [Clostridia bacterium]
MKVCDVVCNSIWYDPRVRKQILEYIRQGVSVTCVGYRCSRYDANKVSELPCYSYIASIDKKYIGSGKSLLIMIKREFAKPYAIYKAIINQKPDVIHANDLDALIPSFFAAKKLKCKLIYDSHEINTENAYYNNKRWYAKILKVLERHICRSKQLNKMVCVSNAAAEYFANEYNIEKPMVVTNCSLKAEQIISDEKNPGFEVLNHGQFYDGRGYDIMVEAIPLLKDYPEINLAVRGFGKLEESLRARVKELGGENFVFYTKVLVEELIPFASKSKVGVAITEAVCLNFELSVSNKLFEYASAGLPVIMSDIPEHRYLNDKYNFGIVISEITPKAFADAVIKLYTDKAFYAQCAENAKKLSNEVNWENEFGKLIEFEYTALLQKRKP